MQPIPNVMPEDPNDRCVMLCDMVQRLAIFEEQKAKHEEALAAVEMAIRQQKAQIENFRMAILRTPPPPPQGPGQQEKQKAPEKEASNVLPLVDAEKYKDAIQRKMTRRERRKHRKNKG